MEAITYLKPNGEWGIEGVDLSTLPPKVYGALCKLRDLEHGVIAIVAGAPGCPMGTGGRGGNGGFVANGIVQRTVEEVSADVD